MGKKIQLMIPAKKGIGLNIPESGKISLNVTRGAGGGSYPPLTEKPMINHEVLIGDKSSEELHLQDFMNTITEQDIDNMIYGGN